jgi:proteasome accessory factor C
MAAWLAEVGASTVDELAERFSMTAEAVRKDLVILSMTAIGPGGGDALQLSVDENGAIVHWERELFTQPLRLTVDDAFAVLTAGQAMLDAEGGGEVSHLASALDKVRAALGEQATAVAVEAPAPPHLETIRRAAFDQVRVRMRYHSAWRDEVTERVVDPYLVYYLDGNWYVRGRDTLRGDTARIFRVSRIVSAEATEERFERPLHPVRPTAFVRDETTVDVRLRLPASGRWIPEAFDVVSWTELDDGWIDVVLPVTGEMWLAELLVRLGPDAEVVEPSSLADAGRRLAERLLALYPE